MKNSGLESRKCHQASERFLLPPLIFPQIQTSSRGSYTQSFEIFSLEIFVAFETETGFFGWMVCLQTQCFWQRRSQVLPPWRRVGENPGNEVVFLVGEGRGVGGFHCSNGVRSFATLGTTVKLGRVDFRKDFWDCYWGQGEKLTNSWPARSQNQCGLLFGSSFVLRFWSGELTV